MQEELKPAPCPFCGGDVDCLDKGSIGFASGDGLLYVVCPCGAMGAGGKNEGEAIAAWNRRTPVSGEVAKGVEVDRNAASPAAPTLRDGTTASGGAAAFEVHARSAGYSDFSLQYQNADLRLALSGWEAQQVHIETKQVEAKPKDRKCLPEPIWVDEETTAERLRVANIWASGWNWSMAEASANAGAAQGGSTNEWGDEAPPVDGYALTCYKCGIDRTKAACAEPWTCPMSVMTPGVVLTQKQASEKRLNELHSADPFMDEPWYKKYSAYMDRLLPAMMIYSGEEVSAKMATAAQGIDHGKLEEADEDAQFEAWWEAHGQFCRAGGGDYEKTFAYRAWQARGQQAGGAESFAVVPRRMTDAMRDAGNEILLDRCKLNLVWSAMLDSAPSIDLNAFIRSLDIGSGGNTKGDGE